MSHIPCETWCDCVAEDHHRDRPLQISQMGTWRKCGSRDDTTGRVVRRSSERQRWEARVGVCTVDSKAVCERAARLTLYMNILNQVTAVGCSASELGGEAKQAARIRQSVGSAAVGWLLVPSLGFLCLRGGRQVTSLLLVAIVDGMVLRFSFLIWGFLLFLSCKRVWW